MNPPVLLTTKQENIGKQTREEREKQTNMEEPLLAEREEKKWVVTRRAFAEELKKLSFMAAPMVAVTVSQYLLPAVAMMMVGHLGELSLASVAIATSFTNVTGFIPLVMFSFFFIFPSK